MAAAAGSLSQQADALVGAVAVFKLTADQSGAPLPGGTRIEDMRSASGGNNTGKATFALSSAPAPAIKKAPPASVTPPKALRAAPKKAPQTGAPGAEDDWESF